MKVIGIAGKAGSGKNTVAGILAAKLVDLGYSVIVDSFCRAIKTVARQQGWNSVMVMARCRFRRHDYLIISDVRMKNEAEYCRKHGVLWWVTGRGGLEGSTGEDITEVVYPDDGYLTEIRNTVTLEALTQLVHLAVSNGRHDKDLIDASMNLQR